MSLVPENVFLFFFLSYKGPVKTMIVTYVQIARL